MSVKIGATSFSLNKVFEMSYADVPAAVQSHLFKCPTTADIESAAQNFVSSSFRGVDVCDTVRSICKWGGRIGPFIGSLVCKNNSSADIAKQMEAAYLALRRQDALSEIMKIRHLSVAFGSKHLRMMEPMKYVVLDRVLSCKLSYSLNVDAYRSICEDCEAIARELTGKQINPISDVYKKSGIWNPRVSGKQWWPADVELALFAEAQGWSAKSTWHVSPSVSLASSRSAVITTGADCCDFESFWAWLALGQVAPTFSKRSKITGISNGDKLMLTTSKSISIPPIQKATVKRYCEDFKGDESHKSIDGNRRWVIGLWLWYQA